MKNKNIKIKSKWGLLIIGVLCSVVIFPIYLFSRGNFISLDFIPTPHNEKENLHVEKPEIVKGIYLTAYSAGTKRFDELLELIKNTELNTMVIDIKTGSGEITFEPKNPNLTKYSSVNVLIEDLDGMIKKAHEAGVYLIARNFVFQDPAVVKKHPDWAVQNKYGGVWKDWKGVTWLDASVRGVWDYNVLLSREVYERGFDEINFDYIRFPSDGPMASIKYNFWDGESKTETMKEFYSYLDEKLRKKGIIISADLFGLTCCNNGIPSIGQDVIDASQYFDDVAQMVYPSHYFDGFIGYANPADHPYEIVKYSLDETNKKFEKFYEENPESDVEFAGLRPWLQDFDIGAIYDAKKVRAQIQAVYDAGGSGWLIWNARNVYEEDAFLIEDPNTQ
ncbi:MAG: hypothetical protein HQ536_02710 [Parcubacteria group bacterium]|nr:hypothetical protein [Parcubacteria group bacterium]